MFKKRPFETRAQLIARLGANTNEIEETTSRNFEYEANNLNVVLATNNNVTGSEIPVVSGINNDLIEDVVMENNEIVVMSKTDIDSDDSVADKDYVPHSDEELLTSEEEEEGLIDDEKQPHKELLGRAEIKKKSEKVKNLTRKRRRDQGSWEKNVRKVKRNLEQDYISAKGKIVKEPCSKKSCKFKCNSKFSFDERTQIFAVYWKLGNIDSQRNFLSSCMSYIDPEYRNPKPESNRSKNIQYSFKKAEHSVQVCKTFFKNTLAINNRIIFTTTKKIDENGFLECDKRGRHENQKKVDADIIEGIRDHIASFPSKSSHYCRAKTNKKYFDGSLNITVMYKLYKEQCIQREKSFAKYSMYSKIINTETNIAFHIPKKDQCANYKNSNEEDKQKIEKKYKDHIKEKELSRADKTKDVEDVNVAVYCFDLQAVLTCPCGEISSFYYKRRLATYNFTIFDIKEKHGFCYTWNEALAKRGANEIASCLSNFISNELSGDIIFYSDNCVGQNKNKFICSMYLYCAQNLKNLRSITHKFLVVGHTQNEGDSMHTVIEKEKKRMLKAGPIYVPAQWTMVLKSAKKTGAPYNVTEMNTTDIKDFKKLCTEIGKNYTINKNKERVNWNNIRVIKVTKDNPYSIFYKYSYENTNYEEIIVRSTNLRNSSYQGELQPAYVIPPPISAAKKKDLMELCRENAINSVHWPFFENLNTENSSDSTDTE